MLRIENLSFRYGRRGPLALRGVSLELADGAIGVLLGKNGSGKTTLFKNILGLCTPLEGSILLDGMDVSRISRRERAARIAYVPQEIRFGALSVFDSVLMGRIARFGLRAGPEDRAAVERILQQMRLEAVAQQDVQRLSGGERQKVAIARALAQEPRLMVLDEPTGNLDIANQQLFCRQVRALAAQGIALLVSLHDLNQALRLGDRFFCLRDGSVRYSGPKEQLDADAVFDVFGARVRILRHEGETIILEGDTP